MPHDAVGSQVPDSELYRFAAGAGSQAAGHAQIAAIRLQRGLLLSTSEVPFSADFLCLLSSGSLASLPVCSLNCLCLLRRRPTPATCTFAKKESGRCVRWVGERGKAGLLVGSFVSAQRTTGCFLYWDACARCVCVFSCPEINVCVSRGGSTIALIYVSFLSPSLCVCFWCCVRVSPSLPILSSAKGCVARHGVLLTLPLSLSPMRVVWVSVCECVCTVVVGEGVVYPRSSYE